MGYGTACCTVGIVNILTMCNQIRTYVEDSDGSMGEHAMVWGWEALMGEGPRRLVGVDMCQEVEEPCMLEVLPASQRKNTITY